MKAIVISGGIGKDAVLRRTQDGEAILGFSVAVDDGYGDKKRTIWFDCSVWGKRGEKLADMLTKGTKVSVSGELSTREHEGKTYLTVRADGITIMGGGERKERSADAVKQRVTERNSYHEDLSDDLPF
jgi:single-strand DNA-binding protein